jgi:uncharacterized membrane protein YjgN (DUF898 family)
MATDGEIDYTHYTREQLEDARWRIDRESFPRNYQALMAEVERRRAADQAAAAAAIQEELREGITHHRPEFRADPGEYFRIWIVNLALTILTLGIYSAWAKVRKLRYFYANTTLAGSAFGYHADPLKILRGRIIAAILVGSYVLATRISPIATLAVFALIGLATPWLVVKSRTFAMRVTSWRGLRFDFAPDYAGAYRAMLGWPLLGIVTLGILMPRAVRERYRFLVSSGRFGPTPFECTPGIARFYKTVFGSIGIGLGLGVIGGLVSAGLAAALAAALPPTGATRRIVLGVVPVLLVYALVLPAVHGYTQARNLNEVFSNTTLGRHRFVSNLSASSLISLYWANLALIVVTLGLYTPWAQVRVARYRLEAIELRAHGSLDEFAAAAAAPVPAAAAEELSSFLDVDFGF